MSNNQMVRVPRDWLNRVALLQMPLDELQDQAVGYLCEPCDVPAEQHQVEAINLAAVATLVDDGDGGLEASWLLEGGTAELFAGMTLLVAESAPDLCAEDGSAQVYTHTDHAEVGSIKADRDAYAQNANDLRESLNRARKAHGESQGLMQEQIDNLRGQLAEAHALLRGLVEYADGLLSDVNNAWAYAGSTGTPESHKDDDYAKAVALLSASAEPNTPKCKSCNDTGIEYDSGAGHQCTDCTKQAPELVHAGYAGKAGLYQTKAEAVCNGEQLIHPVYRIKERP